MAAEQGPPGESKSTAPMWSRPTLLRLKKRLASGDAFNLLKLLSHFGSVVPHLRYRGQKALLLHVKVLSPTGQQLMIRRINMLPALLNATLGFHALVPEQRKQDDDRKRDADQPKQCTFTKTHGRLH